MGLLDRNLEIKTPAQIDLMRKAGLLVGETLELLRGAARAGVTTGELDALAEDHIRSHGGIPSFQGYGHPPFPGTICASVNEEVVHGIPGSRELVEGDVISIDCGAIVEGWHGDAATTVAIGEVPPGVTELMRVTEESLWAGIAAARLSGRISDISRAVEATTASSRTTSATASGRRCTCRPTCPTSYAVATAAPGWSPGWLWPSSRWSPWAPRTPTSSRTTGRW
jgi:methionyl aminopeptidase